MFKSVLLKNWTNCLIELNFTKTSALDGSIQSKPFKRSRNDENDIYFWKTIYTWKKLLLNQYVTVCFGWFDGIQYCIILVFRFVKFCLHSRTWLNHR